MANLVHEHLLEVLNVDLVPGILQVFLSIASPRLRSRIVQWESGPIDANSGTTAQRMTLSVSPPEVKLRSMVDGSDARKRDGASTKVLDELMAIDELVASSIDLAAAHSGLAVGATWKRTCRGTLGAVLQQH
jgi:hypothetical protein